MWGAVLVSILAVAPASPAKPAASDVAAAKKLYTLGERHMADGDAAAAVSLFRKAIAALPQTRSYDELRHDLVMRLGYGMLVAHEQTKDRRYLEEAQRMLERYVERHTQLVGEGERATAERAEVYEQLYEVERRLDPTEQDASAPPESTQDEALPETDPLPAARSEHEERDVIHREVRVRKRRGFTSVDDPVVRERLESPGTDPQTGLWLTKGKVYELTPARAYVRISGNVRPGIGSGRARDRSSRRALAQSALDSVRPELRGCYARAFTRHPTKAVQTELEISIGADGEVRSAKVLGPAVIDAAGTSCVARRLAGARVQPATGRAQRLRIPVVFFWDDAKYRHEGNVSDKAPVPEMPPIDQPFRPPPR
jgi:hypothetical protein